MSSGNVPNLRIGHVGYTEYAPIPSIPHVVNQVT